MLDLRANGGGYRDAAIAVASHFVRGTVVTIQERNGKPAAFAAKAGTTPLGAPLAVLVDGDSASAAEIVAGAVQDDKTGTLVGTRTFGKGLVQETFALPDGGAIKLTTARYLTPAGRDIDKVGITPDVVVEQPRARIPASPAATRSSTARSRCLQALGAAGALAFERLARRRGERLDERGAQRRRVGQRVLLVERALQRDEHAAVAQRRDAAQLPALRAQERERRVAFRERRRVRA